MMDYAHPLFHDPARPCGPPLTEAMTQRAERVLGLRLPTAYIEALRHTNGGPLRRRRLTLEGGLVVYVPDLIGIGYDGGIDGPEGSRFLAEEWDYPFPSVILFSEGRFALFLDYRDQPDEPPVRWIDSDDDSITTVARSFAALDQALQYDVPGLQVALAAPTSRAQACQLCVSLGAVGPVRQDWTGASNFTLQGQPIRVRPNQYRGAAVAPELPRHGWVLEAETPPAGLWKQIFVRDDAAIRLSREVDE